MKFNERKYISENAKELKVGRQVIIPSGRNYTVGIVQAIEGNEVTIKVTGTAFVMKNQL